MHLLLVYMLFLPPRAWSFVIADIDLDVSLVGCFLTGYPYVWAYLFCRYRANWLEMIVMF